MAGSLASPAGVVNLMDCGTVFTGHCKAIFNMGEAIGSWYFSLNKWLGSLQQPLQRRPKLSVKPGNECVGT